MKNWGFVAIFSVVIILLTWATGAVFWDFGLYPWATQASTIAPKVDAFWYVIAYVTTGMFWVVWGLLIVFCVAYRRRPGHRPHYTHGNRTVEVVWTLIPGLMLLALAFAQLNLWAEAKVDFPKPEDKPVVVHTMAEQFQWNFRYPRKDNADFPEIDCYEVDYEEDPPKTTIKKLDKEHLYSSVLYLPVDRKALFTQTAIDVIHSFFLPNMRVKQDAVPGMYVRVWFEPTRFFVVDLKTPVTSPARAEFPKDRTFILNKRHHAIWVESEQEYDQHFRSRPVAIDGFAWKITEGGQYVFDGGYEPEKGTVTALHAGQILTTSAGEVDFAVGFFDVACAELCGAQHYKMKTTMKVGTRRMYEHWIGWTYSNPPSKAWKAWVDRMPAW